MDKKVQISDELLAKYMSGKATSEEEAAVLDYLAENDEHLEDFLNMTSAVELQKSKYGSRAGKKIWKNVIWGISAAAAVAVLLIVGVFAFHHAGNEEEQFAQQQRTEQTNNDNFSTVVPDTADAEDKSATLENKREIGQMPVVQEQKQYADSAKKKNYANMIYPSRNSISLAQGKQTLTFRWNTDAEKIILKITNSKGDVLLDKEFKEEKKFSYTLPESLIHWNTTFYFANGENVSKTGDVKVVSD